jgi:hypothetical protein
MNAFEVYGNALAGALGRGWWPIWPLSTRHAVGNVCTVASGQLLTVRTLGGLGVATPSDDSPYRDSFVYDSEGSVAVTLKVIGTTGPLFSALTSADAGAHLLFARDRTVFATFAGLRETALKEPQTIAQPLVKLYMTKQWEPEWVAVTHVLTATSATVLIAAGNRAEAELRLAAGVTAGPVQVADLAGRVSLARGTGLGAEWLADADATPFCRVVRIKRSWWGAVDADFAPRQRIRGLAPQEVPARLLDQAREQPDDVVETVEFAAEPGHSTGDVTSAPPAPS